MPAENLTHWIETREQSIFGMRGLKLLELVNKSNGLALSEAETEGNLYLLGLLPPPPPANRLIFA